MPPDALSPKNKDDVSTAATDRFSSNIPGFLMYKMYDEIADWWLLLSPKEDYAEEAGFFVKTMRDKGLPDSPTLEVTTPTT